MVAALVDENGNRRSFEQFKKAVLPITDKYNVNWLRTEFDTATASARMAADWQVFQSEKKLYPFLRYETVGDGRVRPEHAALDGMTVSVDSPLLDIYATPNGYKCRCYWIQVASGPERVPKVLPEVPENFRNNPGKSGKLWATMGEYDNDVSRSKRNALEAFADVFVQNKSFQDIRTRVLQYLRKHVLNAKYTYSEGSFTVPSISVLKRLLFRSISILLPDGTNRPATDTKIQALLFLPEIVSRATKIETEEVEGVKLTRIFSNFGANLIVLHLKSKVVGGLMVLHDITLHHPKVGYK
jgi:SPP1 gp7 family putative phage head morphogenesis protein